MKNTKRALYESIMRNVAKQVKKTLNESFNSGDIRIDEDCFAHIMFGTYVDELSKSELRKVDRTEDKFVKEFNNLSGTKLSNIGVSIIKNEGGWIVISGVSSQNFWEYIDILSEAPFPGELYYDDLECFLPDLEEIGIDEEELQEYVEDWCFM